MRPPTKEKNERVGDMMGSGLDRLIGIFNPKKGFERARYRAAHKMLSAYRGAESGYMREHWVGSSGSADQDILTNLKTLRKRSRDLNRNDATAAAVTETVTTNTVGTGLVPQSRISGEALSIDPLFARVLQKQAEKAWEKWVPVSDATERQHFDDIQRLVDISILENGEAFVMPVMIDEPNRRYQLALDVIEPDRIDSPWTHYSTKNKVRQGIEIGERGQPTGYYVKKTHPGDWTYGSGSGLADYEYVPARNVLGRKNMFHLYALKRAGQSRGVPFFAPVMTYFKDLCDYIEAEVVAARIAACFGLVIKTDNDAAVAAGASSEESNTDSRLIQDFWPGMTKYLNPGESIEQIKPERPGAQFDPFVDRILRLICGALNLPYVLVSKDFSKTNYSSARAALLEARKYFRYRQKFLTVYLCQPIYEMVLEEAYLNGEFDVSDFYENKFDYCRAWWISPGWDYIDPLKEAEAASKNIETGVSTLAAEAAAKGYDWEENMEQRAKELVKKKELEEANNIKFDSEPATAGPAEKAPLEDPNKEDKGDEDNE